MQTPPSWIVAFAIFAALPSCLQSRYLESTPQPIHQLAERTVRKAVNDVAVVVESDAWTGPTLIASEVTPLRVRVENKGAVAIRVQYNNFKLVGPAGNTFAALPPINVRGSAPLADVPYKWGPPVPEFVSEEFETAPYYNPVYEDNKPYEGDFPYDPMYFSTYYPGWPQRHLPTPQMIARALPEGVVRPGGHVQGFLYFEKAPIFVERIVFYALFEAADGAKEEKKKVALIKIPFQYK